MTSLSLQLSFSLLVCSLLLSIFLGSNIDTGLVRKLSCLIFYCFLGTQTYIIFVSMMSLTGKLLVDSLLWLVIKYAIVLPRYEISEGLTRRPSQENTAHDWKGHQTSGGINQNNIVLYSSSAHSPYPLHFEHVNSVISLCISDADVCSSISNLGLSQMQYCTIM